jgi:protein involved in polysaccharide export with SLBB domain
MTLLRAALLLLLAAPLATSIQAQTLQDLQLLQSQGALLEQLRGARTADPALSSGNSGVPTSDGVATLNANDAARDPNLLIQSTAPETAQLSVIQRYYQILTGAALPVYGVAEFQQSQDSGLLFFNTMGKDYRLAAGDVLRVTLRGLLESDATYKVGRDGNLILPNLAPLRVAGVTIADAEQQLLDILQYDDASAAVYVSLETARLVTVQVSGAVRSPRTLAVPAFTPLSRVLAYAGGIKETGSLRNIILRDRDGTTSRVDFYDFLRSPVGANDPLVTDASRVFVGSQGNTVAADGFVARPGIYELKEGTQSVSVSELLDLTGTRIRPPGLTVEALYFDGDGLSQSRTMSLDDQVMAGEVLNLRFLPTRLTEAVSVRGAVLEEYQVATSGDLSIADVLRGGATLAEGAFLDFALITDKTSGSRAIDLTKVLNGEDVSLRSGSTLYVFTDEELRALAAADVNDTSDVRLSDLLDAELAELFVNGRRVAYLPPSTGKTFADVIRPFYRLTPETSLDLMILEDAEGRAEARSLRGLIQSRAPRDVAGGDKIYLFGNEFLQINSEDITEPASMILSGGISNVAAATSQGTRSASSEDRRTNWRTLSKLFARAGVVRVRQDGETRALLPGAQVTSLEDLLDILGVGVSNDLADFVLVERLTGEGTRESEIKNIHTGLSDPLANLSAVDFYSEARLIDVAAAQAGNSYDTLRSLTLAVYRDGALVTFDDPKALGVQNSKLGRLIAQPDNYPLFAVYEYFNQDEGFWGRKALSLKDLKRAKIYSAIAPGSRLMLYTTNYLRDLLNETGGEEAASDAEAQLGGLLAGGLQTEVDGLDRADIARRALQAPTKNDAPEDISDTTIAPNVKFMIASSRYVSGAVEAPGYYPVAGAVTLAQLLAAAGGLTDNADLTRVEVVEQNIQDGRIVSGKTRRVNLSKTEARDILLADRYSVNAPAYVNEVATGIVRLEGEIVRPGEYLVARDETLQQLIERAGGLTGVAYPLGAVFTRESLKESQRESNAVLASQLEQAVLQLSQSERDGVGDQIRAVLGYAEQLRQQEAAGRMSVNVTLEDQSAPVYLEQGDTLFIPKRPSHVTVIGSVQKDTTARYSAGKGLEDYIAAAGGLNKLANIKDAYVLLPNGESTGAGRSTVIPPGSVVVVPPKTDRLTALGLTDVVSRVLGNIATSILAINNVK